MSYLITNYFIIKEYIKTNSKFFQTISYFIDPINYIRYSSHK